MQNSYSNRCGEGLKDYEYAGFWVRLAAYLLDSVIVFFALLAVRLVMSGIMAAVKGTPLGGNILFHYDLKDIVLYVSEALYFILCTYYTGTTLGKKAMNLRVIYAGEEESLGLLTVVYRETVGRFLCGVIMGIGYILIGIDKEKRGIHDILCDTRVIYAKKIRVFKMETVFTPLAEPMGKVPGPEEMSGTYSMSARADERTVSASVDERTASARADERTASALVDERTAVGVVDERAASASANEGAASAPDMEWKKKEEEGGTPAGAPAMPWDAPYTRPESQEDDTGTTTERDS